MPLGAARITLLAFSPTVEAEAEVIRRKVGITAYAGAQIDTAQSKFGGSSALFDATDDFLIIPAQSSLDLSGDFTIECWFRPLDVNANRKLFDFRGVATAFGGDGALALGDVILIDHSSGNMRVFLDGSNRASGSVSVTNGNWYHIALSRTSGVCEAYLDGTRIVNYSTSDDYSITSYAQPIGASVYTSPGGSFFDGNIDEIRFSSVGRYTGTTVTTPTEPFQNDANTLLLLHMDGTDGSTFFEDDNGARASIGVTALGNAQVDTAQSKFGGASVLFDGSGDALLAKGPFDFNGSWTVEGWVRLDTVSVTQDFFRITDTNNNFVMWFGIQGSTNKIGIYKSGFSVGTTALNTNTWYHIAMENDNGTCRFYLDGVYQGFRTISGVGTVQVYVSYTSSETVDGYMDEVRITDGLRYNVGNSNFTAPTEPFQNDANTLLLLHMDGTDGSTDFRDDNGTGRSPVGASAVGNAQIDTAQSYFGGASALFDGTGDHIDTSENTMTIGTGDATYECWFRLASLSNFNILMDHRDATSDDAMAVIVQSSGSGSKAYIYVQGAQRTTSTTSISANVWYHIAIVRSGSTWSLYLNGTKEGTDYTNANNFTTTNGLRLSGNILTGSSPTNGHIDEVRVSNTARYTANFLTQTEPFVNDDNTLLLLHMDGTDASTTIIDDNGVKGTNTVVTPLASGGDISSYNDGTNTYVIHEVTSSDTFTPSEAITADVLLVGGGGGGGYVRQDHGSGGGGGAGAAEFIQSVSLSAQAYSLTIGNGGTGGGSGSNYFCGNQTNGGSTTGFGYTAGGGGKGGGVINATCAEGGDAPTAQYQGSGGGGGAKASNYAAGGSGSTDGGAGTRGGGGGGGGAGANGSNYVSSSVGGDGGVGVDMSSYFGTSFGDNGYFGGGGGGAGQITPGSGGTGGGGSGTGDYNSPAGTPGTDGTGGGGGAKHDGGNGIILIRYQV